MTSVRHESLDPHPPSLGSKRPWRLWPIAAVLLVLGLSSWWMLQSVFAASAASDDGPSSADAGSRGDRLALPVETMRAGDLVPPSVRPSFSGLLIAQQESQLSFERGGRILSVRVQEGDAVMAGEVIAELEVSDLDVAERRLKAELEAAQAVLDERIAGPREQEIESARAEVDRLLASLKLAEAEQQREQRLAKVGAGSDRSLDTAEFGWQATSEQLRVARASLTLLLQGTRKEQIAAQRATVQAMQARLDEIEVQRADSRVIAPYDGLVAQRFIDPGTVIAQGTPVIHLISQVVEGKFGLPAAISSTLPVGQAVDVIAEGLECRAVISRMEPRVDRQTRTRAVFVDLADQAAPNVADKRPSHWIAGQVASLRLSDPRFAGALSGDQTASAFWVPTSCLNRGGRGVWTVMVLPGESLTAATERRAVELLQTTGEFSYVSGMLKAGERVIVSGIHRIAPGMLLRDATAPIRFDGSRLDATSAGGSDANE